MRHEIIPTDPEEEKAKGRVALWLDPEDIRWLAAHCSCSEDEPEENRERCARIRFRASAALHKAGLPPVTWNEEANETNP